MTTFSIVAHHIIRNDEVLVGNAQLLPTRQTGASRGLFESCDLRAINSIGNIQIKVWPPFRSQIQQLRVRPTQRNPNDNLESCQDLSMESKIYLGQNSLIRAIRCTQFAYPRNSLYSGIFGSSDLWAINSFGSIQINDKLESYQDLSMESKIYLGQNSLIRVIRCTQSVYRPVILSSKSHAICGP